MKDFILGTNFNKAYLSSLIALFYCLTLSSSAVAEEHLSYNQCIELTKKNNVEILAAEAGVQASQYQTESTRGSYYPQISGNLSYSKTGPTNTFGNTFSGDVYSGSIGATQNIFNGFADTARVNQYEGQVQVAKASLVTTKAKVSFDLKSAIANFLFAKEIEKAAQGFLKRREDNLKMVELRYASGRENKGSLLLAQAYLKQAKADLLRSLHSKETSQTDLKKVLGISEILDSENRQIEMTDEVPLVPPPVQEPDFKTLVLATPDRQQFQAQVDVSSAVLESSKSGFYPTLNLTGSVGKTDNTFFPSQDRWSLGAQLTWPLFVGGKNYYLVKSSTSNLYAAKSKLTNAEQQSLSALKKAFTGFLEAVEDFKVSEAFLLAAKSRAEIAQAKYNNGLLTFDEWDIIENDLISKTKVYIQARRDRIISESNWEQTRGVGVIQ
jgi:outer membrane protein TolC